MNEKNFVIDPAKKELYERELKACLQKYEDKKSELQWVDNSFEESLIEQEMENYARKIKNLNQILGNIGNSSQQVV
jgi:hypothetical protein